jgi:predicted lipid-binding transport protein (Tim44 family)
MNNSFEYLDIILLAIIAGFIILRLRGILGRRTGHEKKDFGDLFGKKVTQSGSEKKVVNLSTGKLDNVAKEQFIKSAKKAYEMIITSFAEGDKKALKPLLNKKIFQNFSDEIDHRKKENLKSELTFVGVKSAEIKNFEKKDNNYTFTVNFVSEIITCKKDRNNNVIEGNPDIIKTVKDVWKFQRICGAAIQTGT